MSDRRAAIEMALGRSAAGDMIVVAGKGHEDYQIIGHERHHFDDREVVREWDSARSAGRRQGVEA